MKTDRANTRFMGPNCFSVIVSTNGIQSNLVHSNKSFTWIARSKQSVRFFLFHSFSCSVLFIFVCLYVLFLKVIVLSVRRFTVSDYPFGILKLLAITLFVLWLTLSDYPLVSWKFWPLHCLIFDLCFLITLWYLQTLSDLDSFDHYIVWSLI